MRKVKLEGTLEEQADQLYEMAQDRMQRGAYTGAVYCLEEINKHLPDYRDVPILLDQAKAAKREQMILLLSSLAGAIVLISVTRRLGITHELASLAIGALGMVLGWFVGYIFYSLLRAQRQRHSGTSR
jgi:hypothetical protein